MKLFLASIAFTLAALPGAALAQSKSEPVTGSLISRPEQARLNDRQLSEADRGRYLMREFARCVIDSRPRIVVDALASEPGKDTPKFNRLIQSADCLFEGEMRFSPSVFRGDAFAELYRRAIGKGEGQLADFQLAPPDLSTAPSADGGAVHQNWFLLKVSQCLSATHSQQMQEIIVAEVGSARRDSAYATLIPEIGGCVPAGATVSFSRSMLEAGFAEYLYRTLPPASVNSEN